MRTDDSFISSNVITNISSAGGDSWLCLLLVAPELKFLRFSVEGLGARDHFAIFGRSAPHFPTGSCYKTTMLKNSNQFTKKPAAVFSALKQRTAVVFVKLQA